LSFSLRELTVHRGSADGGRSWHTGASRCCVAPLGTNLWAGTAWRSIRGGAAADIVAALAATN